MSRLESLEENINSIPQTQDTEALTKRLESLEENKETQMQVEDWEILISRSLQSINKDISDLQNMTLKRGHFTSVINEEYFNSTQYLASVQLKNLNNTDSLMKLPETEDGSQVDKARLPSFLDLTEI